ncbi:hypothetical protein VHEMI08507 [[Torrubiella] hemipterigena]|uniref:Alpha-galactosidase n=1 Tax=[Torrubiella] hemipterigena TaxID=1531966 RepID=A0A0A1TDQ4_9HYPO|nr:hypothetical protein VHEMI08507 [[Torrubiella] hemipterigena]
MKYNAAILTAATSNLVGRAAAAPDPNLQPLPPMGFNNWARFMSNINESIFVDAVAAMARNGLQQAGYTRINLDDAWQQTARAANGSMLWDESRFPNGLPWLTNHIRSKGFLPGTYSDAGTFSCAANFPGTLGHEEQDLQTFADWGFEYLKLDGCYVDTPPGYFSVYGKWLSILDKFNHDGSGRKMVFSNSAPAYAAGRDNLTDWYTLMAQAASGGQLSRHSYDIATYSDSNDSVWYSVMKNYDWQIRLARFQQPGYFNDPDFLIADHPGLTLEEKKSQFALWASFSAPLFISADIPNLSPDELKYLTNKDLIAVNQDKLVQQATLVSQDGSWDVLTKSLSNGDRLVAILNRADKAASLTVPWSRIGIKPRAQGTLFVKNLVTGSSSTIAASAGAVKAESVPSHGTVVYRISSKHSLNTVPTGMIFNTNSLLCLTDSKNSLVAWQNCQGSDAQVWSVSDDGKIRSLLRPTACLNADSNGIILSTTDACQKSSWEHTFSGNLVDKATKKCLTDDGTGIASSQDCGIMTNEQVVGLPVGVKIIQ